MLAPEITALLITTRSPIANINLPRYINKNTLEKVTQILFNQRRKQIKSSLSKFGDPIKICNLLDINPSQRPEELTLKNYEKLSSILSNYQDL